MNYAKLLAFAGLFAIFSQANAMQQQVVEEIESPMSGEGTYPDGTFPYYPGQSEETEEERVSIQPYPYPQQQRPRSKLRYTPKETTESTEGLLPSKRRTAVEPSERGALRK